MEPKSGPRPTTKVRDEMRELTHQRLLVAAQMVFERDGYTRATVGNITKEANLNRATFYLHFNDKADALHEVLQTTLEDTPEYWMDVDAALVSGNWTELRTALNKTLDWYDLHGRTMLPVREALASEPKLAKRTDGNFGRLADNMSGYLARVPADGRDRARLRLQLLIIQFDQIAYRLIVQGLDNIDRGVLLDELTEIWSTAARI